MYLETVDENRKRASGDRDGIRQRSAPVYAPRFGLEQTGDETAPRTRAGAPHILDTVAGFPALLSL